MLRTAKTYRGFYFNIFKLFTDCELRIGMYDVEEHESIWPDDEAGFGSKHKSSHMYQRFVKSFNHLAVPLAI